MLKMRSRHEEGMIYMTPQLKDFGSRSLYPTRMKEESTWSIKTFKNYVKYDHEKLIDELRVINLPPEYTCVENLCDQPANYLWNIFKTAFLSVAENHAPIIQKHVREINNCPRLKSINDETARLFS